MPARFFLPLVSTAWLLVGCAFASSGRAADTLGLDRAVIVTDAAEPSFVQYGVEELAAYLKESTGNDVPVVASPDSGKGVRILVGAKTVHQRFPQDLPDEELGDEGYRVKSVSQGGVDYIIAAGRTPRGTKLALATLMKAIRLEGESALVPVPLDEHGKPAFAKRGMHFNGWPFKWPYSFRTWTEQDWQRYLDILAYQGVNLFYLWPFIEIMPVPLSPEDQACLEECRRVVDYAQKQHGMEVWIMQCTNRVAQDRCGVEDPRLRPYWRPSQKDLHPGKPEDFQAIMTSREAMYRIINNADGVCNIDSDPGASPPESTVGDWVKVLQGCRSLLDRHNTHGKEAKLIHWMWAGWAGPPFNAEHQRIMIHSLRDNLPEPWGLINGTAGYLPLLREEDLLGKTVFLPYGSIEKEPSHPQTNVWIDAERRSLREVFVDYTSKHPELAGVMGNVQTPLLQFPHVYFYTSAMWDLDYCQRPEREVLLDVSRHLYPAHSELLADCYLAMKGWPWPGPSHPDPAKIDVLITQLDALLREGKLGPLGIFGRKLFPDHRIVADSLRLQLKQYAAYHRLLQDVTPTTPRAECERLLGDCLDAYLAWATTHGWHELWGRELPVFSGSLQSATSGSTPSRKTGCEPHGRFGTQRLSRTRCPTPVGQVRSAAGGRELHCPAERGRHRGRREMTEPADQETLSFASLDANCQRRTRRPGV